MLWVSRLLGLTGSLLGNGWAGDEFSNQNRFAGMQESRVTTLIVIYWKAWTPVSTWMIIIANLVWHSWTW